MSNAIAPRPLPTSAAPPPPALRGKAGPTAAQLVVQDKLDDMGLENVEVAGFGLKFEANKNTKWTDLVALVEWLETNRTRTDNFHRFALGAVYEQMELVHGEKESQLEAIFGKGMYNNIREYRRILQAYRCYEGTHFAVATAICPWRVLQNLVTGSKELKELVLAKIAKGERVSAETAKNEVDAEKRAANTIEGQFKPEDDAQPTKPDWSGDKFGGLGDDIEKQIREEEKRSNPTVPASSEDEDEEDDASMTGGDIVLDIPAGMPPNCILLSDRAMDNARVLFVYTNAKREEDGVEPYTSLSELVGTLINLKVEHLRKQKLIK